MYPPSTMTGEPLQLLPPPRPFATMLSLTVMGEPVVKLCRLAPNDELLADKVDHEMVAVPKFWTAPPPFVPAVLPVNVLSVTFTVASLSMAPPPALPVAMFRLNVSRVRLVVPSATPGRRRRRWSLYRR